MGLFKIRRALAVGGGSVQIGADCNVYRTSANVLKTDDGLTVSGVLTASSTLTASGAVNASGTVTLTGRLVAPYGTASPTVATNGQVLLVHHTHVPYLVVRSGGTTYHMAFPTATHGTPTFTANGTPGA